VIYKLIGMAVVKLGWKTFASIGWLFFRNKAAARKRLVAGAGAAAALTVVAGAAVTVGYLATRDTPEA